MPEQPDAREPVYRPPITVHGGAGGIDADLTDMETLAGRLGTVGEALETMWFGAAADAASVTADTDALACPATAAAAALAMGSLLAGPTSLLLTGAALGTLKTGVSSCKTAYEVQDLLRKNGFVQFMLKGGGEAWSKRVLGGLPERAVGLGHYRRMHDGSLPDGQGVADYLPGDSSDVHEIAGAADFWTSTDPALATARAVALVALEASQRPLQVHSAVAESGTRAPRTTRELLASTDMPPEEDPQDKSKKKNNELRLTRVADGKGGHSWIVSLPGTENFVGETDDTTRGMVTNILALLGGRPAAMDGVRLALERQMRAVGADPAKEPVMLVGHSQGGIVAARLASDPAFREKFQVRSVVTAGSPVAKLPPPPDVQMLALEHTTDVVAASEGQKNLDRPNVATVIRDGEKHPPADAQQRQEEDGLAPGRGWKNTHRLRVYLETANSVDIDHSASVERWRQDSAQFLGGESAEAWTVDFTQEEGPQAEKIRVDR